MVNCTNSGCGMWQGQRSPLVQDNTRNPAIAVRTVMAGMTAGCVAVFLTACGRMDAIVTVTLPDGREVALARQTRDPAAREFTTQINLGTVAYFSGPAAVLGELLEVDGCLRVGSATYQGSVVIWPKDFELALDGDRIVVVDESGQPTVAVGEGFSSSGIDRSSVFGLSQFMPSKMANQVKELCGGPYWVIQDQVESTGRYP